MRTTPLAAQHSEDLRVDEPEEVIRLWPWRDVPEQAPGIPVKQREIPLERHAELRITVAPRPLVVHVMDVERDLRMGGEPLE